ncbi:MAG TPA: hypothetical protein VK993_13940 [Chthoniobacterales bacterium]|nr:hypothetical protein [Chthoniobacterales bacterium]
MRSVAACIFVALLTASPADARKPRCTVRAHLEANPQDGPVFSARLRSATTGREVTIAKVPAISELDVVGFQAHPAANGTYGVLFHLNDHGKLALDTLSVERRGSSLYVFVNGRLVDELQIDRRVSDGKLYIAAGLTQNDVELMKKDWRPIGAARK